MSAKKRISVVLSQEIDLKLSNYSIVKNISKAEAIRQFIEAGIDNKKEYIKIQEELSFLREKMNKMEDRLVKLSVRNLKYNLTNYFLNRWQIYTENLRFGVKEVEEKEADDALGYAKFFCEKAKKLVLKDKVDGLNSKVDFAKDER